jgi:hypothetical protein
MHPAPGRRYGISLLDGQALRHIGPLLCLRVANGRAVFRVEGTGARIEVEVGDLVRVDLIQ